VQICRECRRRRARAAFLPAPFPGGSRPRHVRTVPAPRPVRGDSRGGRNGRADHPVGRDPKIRVSPEDLPLDDIRRARALLLDGHDVPRRFSRRGPPGRWRPVVLDAEKCRRGRRNFCPCAITSWPRTLPGAAPPRNLGGRWRPEILRRYAPRTSTVTLGPRGAFGCDARKRSSRLPSASRRWTPRAPGTFSTPVSCTPFSGAAFPGDPRLRQYRGRPLLPRNGGVRDPTLEAIRVAGTSIKNQSY